MVKDKGCGLPCFSSTNGCLLLDEPTTYLDITYQVEILDLLTDLSKKRGTVMVLHDINLSARYADYLFAVKRETNI